MTIGIIAPSPALDRTIVLEQLVPGSVHRPSEVVEVAGGKGCNAARSAAVLGMSVRVVTAAGGTMGRWLVDQLEDAGIEVDAVVTDCALRICTSILDRSSGLLTEVYEPASALSDAEWQEMARRVRRMSETVDVVAWSGSLPERMPAAAVGALLTSLGNGTVAGVPGVAVDCGGGTLGAALRSSPGVVKINRSEALGLGLSASATLFELADGVAQMAGGPCVVVVTGGEDGAVLREPSGRSWHGRPPSRGAFGVGCGDAFFGGLLTALVQERSIAESLKLALATASANAEIPGAGLFDPQRLHELERATCVQEVR
ncbi:MAG: 1-phosphofructokinase family hexose kinase [Acidimicrobiales bacterium]